MIKRLLHRAGLAGLLAFATLLAACGGGGGDGGGTSTANGQLRIRLTDSQSCNYESVFVTVTEVRVSQSGTASDSDATAWVPLTLNPARQVDLMTLRNGVFEELGTLPLPAGTYQQVRLVLASNGASAPYANYLTLDGPPGTPIALKTPSAQQSGLKLNVHATVEPGQLTELTLDFDPCKSVVKAGNSGNYNLKPVITAYTNAVNDIEGYTVAGALVSAQQAGVSLKSTTADAQGLFVLWPINAGTYDVVITAPAYATAVLEDVVVGSGVNAISDRATPLAPAIAASAPASLSGTVTVTGVTDVYATTRALQYLGTKTIEVAATSTAIDGTYNFTLPTVAPGRAPWTPGVMSYTFTGFDAAAGLYRVEALADGFAVPKLFPALADPAINLKVGNATGVDFLFAVP
jgi:Domain of unknown function (DUF4382)